MNATTISRSNRELIFILALLAVLSLVLVWSGAARMIKMQTQVSGRNEFAQLKPQDEAKIVVEVTEASGRKLRGKLLERRDETHYARTEESVDVSWGAETKLVMGKVVDIHAKAVVHIIGRVAADHSVQASQVVILTNYVQVK